MTNSGFLILVLLSLITGCSHVAEKKDKVPGSKQWESKYHAFKAEYSDPWELISSSTTTEQTLFSLTDKSKGEAYIVKITSDVLKEKLPDSSYFEAIKQQMLEANEQNELLSESDVQFHGKKYHKQVFRMISKKWGSVTMHAYTRRTGIWSYSVQIIFPHDENSKSTELPKELKELDKNVKINGK